MNDDCVVVIRTKTGEDILALLIGSIDSTVMIEHPYFAKYNPQNRSIVMVPYCPLSDESYFEMSRDRIEFLVTANAEVSKSFLDSIRRPSDEMDESILTNNYKISKAKH